MFETLLVANRGEIALRVMRTARRLGIRTVAVYSDADRDTAHVAYADEAYRIGGPAAAESYLRQDAILEAARRSGTQAIHPGYGFLSENPSFVDAVQAAGLVFVGPPSAAIRAMGLKDTAKALMDEAGVPTVPGYHGREQDAAFLAGEADRIGYPVLIKAAAGGGGKGMRRVDHARDFPDALSAARREARSAFGDDRVLVERCLVVPRHIEIQVFADSHGNAVHLFERDCSMQRRHQKVIEEAPAPAMPEAMRAAMGAAAVRAAQAVGYEGAGTVEFIADVAEGLREDRFYFMEMNTRLQVEHPVTEMITGLDLVEWQLRVAAGEPLPRGQEELTIDGHAVEARVYAEDPGRNFMPQTGRLSHLRFAGGHAVRIDAGVREGDFVTPFYDPMIAKVIAHGPTRAVALARLGQALSQSCVEGFPNNLGFLAKLVAQPDFAAGTFDTGLIARELDAILADAEAPPLAAALAALELSDLLPDADSDRLANFRLWGSAVREVDLAAGPERRRMTVTALGDGGFRVEEGDVSTALRLTSHPDTGLRAETQGRSVPVQLRRSGDEIVVGLPEGTFRFAAVRPGNAANSAGGDHVLRAAMPGIVRIVHVAPGDLVEADAPLLVTEAMKMEMPMTAPGAGRIASVEVAPGDQVEVGAVLIVMEPVEGDAADA
ncbi:MAG: methylcrotonoyl-CoA carboxylase [Methylorubrum populi]